MLRVRYTTRADLRFPSTRRAVMTKPRPPLSIGPTTFAPVIAIPLTHCCCSSSSSSSRKHLSATSRASVVDQNAAVQSQNPVTVDPDPEP
eukprot:535422-Rhodomonas_salina.1